MKRKTREEKAITLIALIITIIVLLILAVVAINAVTGDGIIQHATNSKTEYEKVQAEDGGLTSYNKDYLVTQGKVGNWKQEGEYIVNSNGLKIPIGAKVNYDCYTGVNVSKLKYVSKANNTGIPKDQSFEIKDNSMEWYVLGEEYGKIILISSSGVIPTNATKYTLTGRTGYINGTEELNKISSTYGHGVGAQGARSLNAEDINKLAGVTEEIKKAIGSYGIGYEYKYDGNEVKFSKNGAQLTQTGRTEMAFVDGVINANTTTSKKIKTTHYFYSLEQYINNPNLIDIILNKVGDVEGDSTWLATQSLGVIESSGYNGDLWYGMLVIDGRNTSGTGRRLLTTPLFKPQELNTDYISNFIIKVRPVVILEKNTILTESNGIYNITK